MTSGLLYSFGALKDGNRQSVNVKMISFYTKSASFFVVAVIIIGVLFWLGKRSKQILLDLESSSGRGRTERVFQKDSRIKTVHFESASVMMSHQKSEFRKHFACYANERWMGRGKRDRFMIFYLILIHFYPQTQPKKTSYETDNFQYMKRKC